jgi:hypothetical protein
MSNRPDHLNILEEAILTKHGCKPTHKGTVHVHEQTDGNETVWEGTVEEFDLTGHKRAKVCYAWQHIDGQSEPKIIMVLGNRLIDSPQRAVQAAIFVDAQPAQAKFSKGPRDFKQRLQESVHETAVGTLKAG